MKKSIFVVPVLFLGLLCQAQAIQAQTSQAQALQARATQAQTSQAQALQARATQAQTPPDSLFIGSTLTKEVVDKLSNEELMSLIRDIEVMKYRQDPYLGMSEEANLARQFANPGFVKGIAISLIICILVFIVLIVSLPFYFNLQKTKSFHRMVQSFTEKNQEIPKELIVSVSHKRSDFHKGVVLIATGIAISLAFLILHDHGRLWAIGLIPLIIGIGYYIISRMAK